MVPVPTDASKGMDWVLWPMTTAAEMAEINWIQSVYSHVPFVRECHATAVYDPLGKPPLAVQLTRLVRPSVPEKTGAPMVHTTSGQRSNSDELRSSTATAGGYIITLATSSPNTTCVSSSAPSISEGMTSSRRRTTLARVESSKTVTGDPRHQSTAIRGRASSAVSMSSTYSVGEATSTQPIGTISYHTEFRTISTESKSAIGHDQNGSSMRMPMSAPGNRPFTTGSASKYDAGRSTETPAPRLQTAEPTTTALFGSTSIVTASRPPHSSGSQLAATATAAALRRNLVQTVLMGLTLSILAVVH